MTAPVEETVESHPPVTAHPSAPVDRVRVRPRGVRARVKAGTPVARARVRALTPGRRSRELAPVEAAPSDAPRPGAASTTPIRGAVSEGTNPVEAVATPVGGRSRDEAGTASSQAAPTDALPATPTDVLPATSPEASLATSSPAPAVSRTEPDADSAAAGAASRPASRPASRFGRALRTHFGTLAGTVILVVVFWRMGTGVFVDGLRRIDGVTLAAAVGIGVLTTVFSAWRWCAVTRALGLRLPLGPAVADYYRALFLNAALPGGVLGDVHRAVRHGQSSGDMGRGVRAVVIERTAGQLVLAVVGVTVLLVLPSPVLEQTRHVAGITTLAALGALAIWAAIRMGRRPGRAAGRGPGRVRAALTEARGVLLHRHSGPAVLLSSVAVLAGYVATFLLAARVAGSAATPLRLLPLALLALIAMSLPLNVGGWGPREGVTAWSFGAAGLGASQGLTVAVVYGVLSFAAALPGALVLVGRWYGSLRARRQSPTGESCDGTGAVPHASEVTNEKYAPKESTNPASNSFPFAADARDGRPMTPESV